MIPCQIERAGNLPARFFRPLRKATYFCSIGSVADKSRNIRGTAYRNDTIVDRRNCFCRRISLIDGNDIAVGQYEIRYRVGRFWCRSLPASNKRQGANNQYHESHDCPLKNHFLIF